MKLRTQPKTLALLIFLSSAFFTASCGDDILVAPAENTETPAETPTAPVPADECASPAPLSFDVNSESPAELLLVLDRSGSMTESGQWLELQRSLQNLLTTYDDSIAFGLLLFPAVGFNACGVSDVSVSPSLRSGTQILDLIDRSTPLGGTPTAEALMRAKSHLESLPSTRKAVILATDGGPGCNDNLDWSSCECIEGSMCTGFSANCLDDVRTLNAVNLLRQASLPTYVVGIPGSESVDALLDRMAVAGGTDLNGEHLAVSSELSLADAFAEIAVNWSPCSYPVPEDTTISLVTIDEREVSESAQGYSLSADGRTLQFGDAACALLRDAGDHQVRIEFECQ